MAEEPNFELIIVFASLMMFIMAWGIILFVVVYRRSLIEKGKKIEQLESEKRLLSFSAACEAEEKERERIANNLHDEISLKLTVNKQILENIVFDLEDKVPEEAQKLRNEIEKLDVLRDAINNCASDLVPAYLIKKGLMSALEDQIVQLNCAGKIKASFKVIEGRKKQHTFGKQEVLHIYRICLELINNLLKHGRPDEITITAAEGANELQINIDHNGSKFSNMQAQECLIAGTGLGLKSMNARGSIIKASISYQQDAEPAIQLKVPFRTNEEVEGK